MPTIGTPFSTTATKVLLCGSGELGKEVVIALQRLGAEVIACDRYANAPAMQVADRAHVFSMLDGAELRRVIELERPDFIVPEIEAIDTAVLVQLEKEGFTVVPTANAARLTMNREGIRTLAAETLKLPTSSYRFADSYNDFSKAVHDIGFPCIVAHYELIWQRSKHDQNPRRDRKRMALRSRRWPRWRGSGYCRRCD